LAGFATLYEVLTTFARVLAPVLPFVTERLHQDLVVSPGADGPASVHLADFPTADTTLIDLDLERDIAVVRRVVSAGHALRKRAGVRVRQPLANLTVITHDARTRAAVEAQSALIAGEMNVRRVVASAEDGGLVDLTAKADFRRLGPRLGSEMNKVAAGIASLAADEINRLLVGETVSIDGHEVTQDDVIVTRSPRPGTVVETDAELAVALNTELDDDLIGEGRARDFVSRVQGARRQAGLDVSDRISLSWNTADDAVAAAIDRHAEYIAAETLAVTLAREDELVGDSVEVDGVTVEIRLDRV
jgi:isoleucyl-tRNA synthetase